MELSPLPTIATTTTTNQLTAQVSELTKCLDELSVQMSKAVNTFSCRPGKSPSPAPQRSHTPVTDDNLCWYHRKFGDDDIVYHVCIYIYIYICIYGVLESLKQFCSVHVYERTVCFCMKNYCVCICIYVTGFVKRCLIRAITNI